MLVWQTSFVEEGRKGHHCPGEAGPCLWPPQSFTMTSSVLNWCDSVLPAPQLPCRSRRDGQNRGTFRAGMGLLLRAGLCAGQPLSRGWVILARVHVRTRLGYLALLGGQRAGVEAGNLAGGHCSSPPSCRRQTQRIC